MCVSDVIFGLRLSEFQRVVVKTYCRNFGTIPICGGYRDKVLRCAGDREVIGANFRQDCLHLKVSFQKDDLV